MKKFYRISYSCRVYGRYYTFIRHKEKQVKAEIIPVIFFMKTEEENINKIIKEQAEKLIQNYKKELENKKGIYLADFSVDFIPTVYFNTIDKYDIIETHYREATIEECIKKMAPTEYKELYGDTLKLSTGE